MKLQNTIGRVIPLKGLFVAFSMLIFLLPNFSFAQKKEPYSGVGFNQDKIELLYQNVTQTTQYSSGRSSTSVYKAPLLRINNGTPTDYSPDLLLPYLEKCPSAKREVIAYKIAKKKSVESILLGILIGGAVGGGCLIGSVVATEKESKLSRPLFFIGIGAGAGFVINGVVQGNRKGKKAREHLQNSVVFYNDQCYKTTENTSKDSIPSSPTLPKAGAPTTPAPLKNSGVIENYQDTFFYKLLRNDPKNSTYFAVGLNVLEFDIANFHGFGYLVGGSLYFQKTARFAIEGTYRTALVDNFSEDASKGTYSNDGTAFGEITSGEAVDYKRGREMAVVASIEFAHKNRIRKEEVYIGKKTINQAPVKQYGDVKVTRRTSWAARIGATDYRSVWYNGNLPFATSELPEPYVDPNTGEVFQSEYNLRPALAMVQSTSFSFGVSRRTLRDLKVAIQAGKKEKIRESVSYSEWYADLCYASNITTGAVYDVYRDPLTEIVTIREIKTDQTPLENMGWRAGVRMAPHLGFSLGVEFGQRPGPNESRAYLLISGQLRLGKVLKK